MKVNEIFNKKRIIAFVMAFAMVVTSLSGISFASNAEELDDTTPIYRLYNANTSDHFFTASEAQRDEAVAKYGYTYEKVAYYEPLISETPVYCMVCPNSAEHIYSANIEELSSWVATHPEYYLQDDGDPVFYSADALTGTAVFQFFNPNQTADKASHMGALEGSDDYNQLVAWKWQNDGVKFYAIANKTASVELIDQQGLQADGTALPSDTLQIQFGASFGVPVRVAWYKDGAVCAVYTSTITSESFMMNGDLYYGAPVGTGKQLPVGTYSAVVETADMTYVTEPSITVTEQGIAVMSGYDISDNYEALQNVGPTYANRIKKQEASAQKAMQATAAMIPIATKTTESVIGVTLNKDYTDGNLTLVTSNGGVVTDVVGTIDLDKRKESDSKNATETLANVEKASKFTASNLYKEAYKTEATEEGDAQKLYTTSNGNIDGIYYTAASGQVHYMFLSKAFNAANGLTRGTSYTLVYQTDEETAIKVGDDLDDFNTTDEELQDYVMAPTAVDVTNRQSTVATTGWSAQLTMMGMDATWITALNQGNAKLSLWENASVKNEGGTEFTPAAATLVVGGALVDASNPNAYKGATAANPAVYAEFYGAPGIFGKEKVELKSAAAETTVPAATAIELEEYTLDPDSALVKFDGLRTKASGTVYILQGDASTTTGNVVKKDLSTAVATATVAGGSTEVVVDNVFEEVDINGKSGHVNNSQYFAAIFVPDDTDLYGKVATANDFEITDKATTYNIKSGTSKVTVNSTTKTGSAIIVAENQFGSEIALTNDSYTALNMAITAYNMNGQTLVPTASSGVGTGKLTEAVAADGTLTLTVDTGTFKKDSYHQITLPTGQKLTLVCQEDATGGTDDVVFQLYML